MIYERKTNLPDRSWSVIAGGLPLDLGKIDLNPVEMMFWMYCPISTPEMGTDYKLPDNLRQFIPIIHAIGPGDVALFRDRYVYLTAKTLWVAGDYIGNRPGWHIDGFGTDDVNYIWSSRAPTEFIDGAFRLSTDCAMSMAQMEGLGHMAESLGIVQTFPDKHLLRLDNKVIHRSPAKFEPGMRTFVKVSLSKDRYDLQGNSINHRLPDLGPMVERKQERNHPSSVTGS